MWIACGLLALPACGGGEVETAAGVTPTSGTAEPAADAPKLFAGDAPLADLETIPTQDEMDAQAAAEITEENADEVYEQLKAQLEAETGG